MAIEGWTFQDWFDLFSSIGIVGSFWLGILTLRSDTKTRRVANLLTLIQNHRELWSDFCRNPLYTRVPDASADLTKEPITHHEHLFVGMVVQQLNGTYQAMANGLTIEPEGLRADIRSFFSLPIPKAVWPTIKLLQNQDFAAFIDSSLKENP